ncbi:MAG: Mu transposase C-terminal domain-containing protein [Rhodobacteraceae bacterium]|nr:Mu transposase C-terminal domain-containing protein [Paracoccaceae bacterium]
MSNLTPAKEWWTASELAVAGLPDMPDTRQGVEKWIKSINLRGHPDFARKRQGRGGGWEYHWKALPMRAQRKLLSEATSPEVTPAPDRDGAWTWFEGLPDTAQDKARVRLKIIQSVEALEGELGRHMAVESVARIESASARSIWNWLGMIEGVRRDDRLPYLAPRHRAAKRKETRDEVDPDFMDWLKSDYLRLARPSFSTCYRRAVRVAQSKGWAICPEHTMRRRYKEQVSRPTEILARYGLERLKQMFPPQVRDKSALRAMEVVNADYHKFDVFVRWPGEAQPVRPQMVAFQDIYSGLILSWRLDLTANSNGVMLAAGDMIEDWGIPDHVVLDNGREFAAKLVTGGTATRFRFKVREDDIPGLFVALGVDVHWATPYSGQSKPIERAFRDMCDAISRDPRLEGAWTGNTIDAKPENYGNRAVPLDEFLRIVEEGIQEHNLRQGRRSEVAWGRSFREVFDESYASVPIRKATEAQRRLWLMGAEGLRGKSSTGELKFQGNQYWAPWMHEIAGTRVIARFDPADLWAGLHVYSAQNEYLGHAPAREKGGFLSIDDARRTARDRAAFLKAERAAVAAHRKLQARDLGRDLDAATMPDPAPAVEAKVVRPVFEKRRDPAPEAPRPDLSDAQAAVVADLQTRRVKPNDQGESDIERFKRALELEAKRDAGEALAPEQERFLIMYSQTSDYRAHKKMMEDFGVSYLG